MSADIRCQQCNRLSGAWDGCSRIECPKRRPWGNANAGLEAFDAQVPIGQRADIRQPGPRGIEPGGYRKRAHIPKD